MPTINREHKDRLFSFLFGSEPNREWTLSLYNAINGTSYTDPEDILFTTIDDAVYMGMKNDLSFILFHVMNIYEQQSTFNPNMPVRQLMYAGKLYDKYIHKNKLNIYGRRVVRLPAPRLVVFYNGAEQQDDRILHLSDAFAPDAVTKEPDIQVKVHMININYGHNRELLQACQPLAEYAWLVEQIRMNRNYLDIEQAVDKAIDDMPETYAIRLFLIGHRAEVKNMCITEYNEAETLQMIREEERAEARAEAWAEALEEGRKEGRKEGQKEGRAQGEMNLLARLVRSGDMTVTKAAEYAGMTVEQFQSYTC
ncbi:MAG: hypothetical protein HFG64_11880 [Lachnospiraceae bacterium]|nr:hypothetical protein [Lachnospiraceae bacterium]